MPERALISWAFTQPLASKRTARPWQLEAIVSKGDGSGQATNFAAVSISGTFRLGPPEIVSFKLNIGLDALLPVDGNPVQAGSGAVLALHRLIGVLDHSTRSDGLPKLFSPLFGCVDRQRLASRRPQSGRDGRRRCRSRFTQTISRVTRRIPRKRRICRWWPNVGVAGESSVRANSSAPRARRTK